MIVMPAIDLRDGACVQLVGGSYDDERVRIADPIAVAQRWQALGFTHLHIVDLDAATDRGSNRDVVRRLLQRNNTNAQVGGGVSTIESIRSLIRDGAQRVVVGTRAIEDLNWLRQTSQTFRNKIIVAADTRDRTVVTRGWRFDSSHNVLDLVPLLNPLPLAGIMVTAVHREGRLAGPDLPLVRDITARTPHKLYVAGGIASLADLRLLEQTGAHAAIVGMALYTGALDPRAAASEFAPASPSLAAPSAPRASQPT